MLVRFEAENQKYRYGVYNFLPSWFFEDYLALMNQLPVPSVHEGLVFFFTQKGYNEYGFILGDVFWENALKEDMERENITLFASIIEEPKTIPVYEDEYQKAYKPYDLPDLYWDKIENEQDWLNFEQKLNNLI